MFVWGARLVITLILRENVNLVRKTGWARDVLSAIIKIRMNAWSVNKAFIWIKVKSVLGNKFRKKLQMKENL